MVFWNSQKYLDNFGVELPTCTALYFLASMRHRKGFAIVAVAQHGIGSIGDRDDACPEWNLFTAQAPWITRAIEEFLMCQDKFSRIAQCGAFASRLESFWLEFLALTMPQLSRPCVAGTSEESGKSPIAALVDAK
jgi:hypothetical protein